MKKRTIWISLLIVAVTGAAGLLVYRQSRGGQAGPAGGRALPAVAVETAEVSRATLRDVGRFSGSLQPRARFVVAPKVGGRLQRLFVDVGDLLLPGQPIAALDDQEYAQQVAQARAALVVAEAGLEEARISLEAARREMKRVSELRDKRIASASEFDAASDRLSQAEARHTLVQAQLRQQQVALELAQARLADARIRADWEEHGGSRVIGERFADVGALLRANDPIVSVLDIGSLQAAIQVPEQSYGRIRIGQPAVISTDILPERGFDGRVIRVAPFIQEMSRQGEVWIEVPNPDRFLKPGMFVTVELEFARRENTLTIPSSALVRNQDRQGVFLVDGEAGRARFVQVRTGIIAGDRVEVLDPPLSGLVVTLGHHLLQDGSPVLLPGAAPRPASHSPGSPRGATP